jgi:hypothetical protein
MAPSQSALYADIADDLQLSWSEAELPERERRGLMGRGGEGAQQARSSGCHSASAIEFERGRRLLDVSRKT